MPIAGLLVEVGPFSTTATHVQRRLDHWQRGYVAEGVVVSRPDETERVLRSWILRKQQKPGWKLLSTDIGRGEPKLYCAGGELRR